jgi:hypothetical protein
MTVERFSGADLQHGGVVSRTLRVSGRHSASLIVLALLIGWLPNLALSRIPLPTFNLTHRDMHGWWFSFGRDMASVLLFQALLFAAARVVIAERASVGEALVDALSATARSLSRIVPTALIVKSPVLIAMISLIWIAGEGPVQQPAFRLVLAGLASILSTIADVAIAVAVGVFPAVLAGEPLGPLRALQHSARLLSGYRWRFLALFLIYFVGLLVAQGTLGALALARSSLAARAIGLLDARQLVGSLADVLFAVMLVVIYFDRRLLIDGMRTSDVAAVFD